MTQTYPSRQATAAPFTSREASAAGRLRSNALTAEVDFSARNRTAKWLISAEAPAHKLLTLRTRRLRYNFGGPELVFVDPISRDQTSSRRLAIKFSVFCGVSVDGFLARPDDTFDFLYTGEKEPHGFTEFLASVDVVVIGRRTFEVVLKLGHLALYGNKPLIVLSSSPLAFSAVQGPIVERTAGEPTEIVGQLEARGFRHAYLDGGVTIQRFLAAGCIDRLVITRVPVLIGAGIPLFGPLPRDIRLRHIATNSYAGGLVQSEYQIG